MFSLAQLIPFRIVTAGEMPLRHSNGKYPTEWFGWYNSSGPEIYLCPQRIEGAIAKLREQKQVLRDLEENEAKKVLYAIVVIHLLAHAIMDASNQLTSEGTLQKYKNRYQNIVDELGLLIEESFANMITIEYFLSLAAEANDPNDVAVLGAVKEFMSIQPLPYKFGLTQFSMFRPDWREWREKKRKCNIYCEKS